MIDHIVNLVNGETGMRTASLSLIVALGLLLSGHALAQDAARAQLDALVKFDALARQCAPSVDPSTLSAVVQHESGFNALAINVNGPDKLPRQPANAAEAIATAQYLASKGYSFDAGLGQINSANVRKFDLSWDDIFKTCPNLQAAAAILTQCYARARAEQSDPQAALRDALSCYNTGTFNRGQTNGYVHNVELAAATPQGVQVPAIIPIGAGPAAQVSRAAPNKPQPESVDAAPAMSDAFSNSRGDAFDRAALTAQQADAIHAMEEAKPVVAAPIVLPSNSDVNK